ncbi:MAG TPA: C39 family peptidase [Defluviitaleaceae bacterium]|nr:hypothetical protein [Candidatus Epulonipiscium sp.]HOQ15832.1 C39 family peptidase [Defluviitaleaceae bacterium]HPT76068.1 C39 family peptidase [Defluviitaleaceae bacterium]HQD50631.1 C39 family peptidase [Defluviitaleaceae bacterium]
MKKKAIVFWIFVLGLVTAYLIVYSKQLKEISQASKMIQNDRSANIQEPTVFEVYYKNKNFKSFKTKEEAIEYSKKFKYTYVKASNSDKWIYNNFKPFILFDGDLFINDYDSFADAVFVAREKENSVIYFKNNGNIIWSKTEKLQNNVLLDVPVILQYPELPRGCEVTSLAMLLNYAGIEVDKIELAKKIKKDETPFSIKGNRVYFGNPNDGFVGDMYSLKAPGLGVFNGPVEELMKEYLPDETINLTGCEFEDLFHFISRGYPVWAITNTMYVKLDNSEFEIWMTPNGPVEITYKLHAVVITGYDENNIYLNDPFYNQKNIKVNKERFKESWNQLGRQAISYIGLRK